MLSIVVFVGEGSRAFNCVNYNALGYKKTQGCTTGKTGCNKGGTPNSRPEINCAGIKGPAAETVVATWKSPRSKLN